MICGVAFFFMAIRLVGLESEDMLYARNGYCLAKEWVGVVSSKERQTRNESMAEAPLCEEMQRNVHATIVQGVTSQGVRQTRSAARSLPATNLDREIEECRNISWLYVIAQPRLRHWEQEQKKISTSKILISEDLRLTGQFFS